MTPEQIGLYQAVLDDLLAEGRRPDGPDRSKGAMLAAITALKQICNHPAAYRDDGQPLAGRSGKLARLEEIVESVFAAGERVLIFTHFAPWGRQLAAHLSEVTGTPIECYDGSLSRAARDKMVADFQNGAGPGRDGAVAEGRRHRPQPHRRQPRRALRPLVEPGRRGPGPRPRMAHRPDATVISHRLVCPGTVDERVEEVVAGKRHIADLVLPKSSSIADLNADQLRLALGLRPDELLTEDDDEPQHTTTIPAPSNDGPRPGAPTSTSGARPGPAPGRRAPRSLARDPRPRPAALTRRASAGPPARPLDHYANGHRAQRSHRHGARDQCGCPRHRRTPPAALIGDVMRTGRQRRHHQSVEANTDPAIVDMLTGWAAFAVSELTGQGGVWFRCGQ